MKKLILLTLVCLSVGCQEARNLNESNNSQLSNDEKFQESQFKAESMMTEVEVDAFEQDADAEGLSESLEVHSEIQTETSILVIRYPFFRSLVVRLKNLDQLLDRVIRLYQGLSERLQEYVKPWLQEHLKYTHRRLETLKSRLSYHLRIAYTGGWCVQEINRTLDTDASLVTQFVNSSIVRASDGQEARVDVEGVIYIENTDEVIRPYICVPTASGECRDICTDNHHLVKRLIYLIEDIQDKIEKFIRSME